MFRGDYFTLNSTPNSSEFTVLYDQYRIVGVKRTFLYSSTGADTTGSLGPYGPAGAPILYMVRDYDDSNTPANINEFFQRPYVKIGRITSVQKMYIRPKVARPLYQGATFAYGPSSGWIDVANDAVPHYGIKWICVPQAGSNYAMGTIYGTITVIDKYYLEFKNPR